MINRVQMRHAMKTSLSSVILLTLFALCAYGGEVERFIRETLEEQRARNAAESSEVGKIIDDAVKGQKMPELELPKESVFTSKDKERGITTRVGVGSYTHSFSISGYNATGAFSVTVEK